jgi:hypothetical protein
MATQRPVNVGTVPLPAVLLGPESAREDLLNALAVLVCFKDTLLPPVDNAAVRRRIESALAKMPKGGA